MTDKKFQFCQIQDGESKTVNAKFQIKLIHLEVLEIANFYPRFGLSSSKNHGKINFRNFGYNMNIYNTNIKNYQTKITKVREIKIEK